MVDEGWYEAGNNGKPLVICRKSGCKGRCLKKRVVQGLTAGSNKAKACCFTCGQAFRLPKEDFVQIAKSSGANKPDGNSGAQGAQTKKLAEANRQLKEKDDEIKKLKAVAAGEVAPVSDEIAAGTTAEEEGKAKDDLDALKKKVKGLENAELFVKQSFPNFDQVLAQARDELAKAQQSAWARKPVETRKSQANVTLKRKEKALETVNAQGVSLQTELEELQAKRASLAVKQQEASAEVDEAKRQLSAINAEAEANLGLPSIKTGGIQVVHLAALSQALRTQFRPTASPELAQTLDQVLAMSSLATDGSLGPIRGNESVATESAQGDMDWEEEVWIEAAATLAEVSVPPAAEGEDPSKREILVRKAEGTIRENKAKFGKLSSVIKARKDKHTKKT